jgi:hypothetical protein
MFGQFLQNKNKMLQCHTVFYSVLSGAKSCQLNTAHDSLLLYSDFRELMTDTVTVWPRACLDSRPCLVPESDSDAAGTVFCFVF